MVTSRTLYISEEEVDEADVTVQDVGNPNSMLVRYIKQLRITKLREW